MNPICIRQARLHNLNGFDITIPQDKLVVVSGVSGSGKSTLIFDILFEEGRKRYLHAIGALSELGEDRGFDQITGLRPAVAVKQGTMRRSNPRSVVGSRTKLLHYIGALFAHEHNSTSSPEEAIHASTFSFNSPNGMCYECTGRGYVFQLNLEVLLPEESTSLVEMYKNCGMESSFKKFTDRLAKRFGIDPDEPFRSYPEEVQDFVLYGLDPEGSQLTGLDENLKARLLHGKDIANAMTATTCDSCSGFKLNETALDVKIKRKHIGHLAQMTIGELDQFILSLKDKVKSSKPGQGTRAQILQQIENTLHLLKLVNLDYLTLYRPIPTLSGGEAQRLSLMSFLGSDLESVLYIFDEPTTGLHEIEKSKLLEQIASLQDSDNSVIIVEHDAYTLSVADHIIDVGPKAGVQGGDIVFEGTYKELLRADNSITGQFLSGKKTIPSLKNSQKTDSTDNHIELVNVQTNNLQSISVKIPLERLVGIAGVSGSGKSSLIADTLVPVIQNHLADETTVEADDVPPELNIAKTPPRLKKASGLSQITRCVEVSQKPIGRRKGSNPATYLGIWDRIRRCFANQALAKDRGYSAGYFSFNSDGACQHCNGNGTHQLWLGVAMVDYECEVCRGQRYNSNVLEVKYKSYSISDVLGLSAEDALELFKDESSIARLLDVLVRTGMGYVTLGQPTTTLSGGEAQRLKLAKEIGRKAGNKGTLFILDEPTTGLSLYDTAMLLELLIEVLELGSSVIIVEHDPKVLSQCDWIIEIGPGGGKAGGQLIAQGTVDSIKQENGSVIGAFLD